MKKSRSRAYPAVDLEEAIEIFRGRLAKLDAEPIARDWIVEALGYSSSSGGIAGRKVAALVQFGFIERRGNLYAVSKFGDYVRTLKPGSPDWEAAMKTAFFRPLLFQEIVAAYEHFGRLPSYLRDLLAKNFRIAENACRQVEELFVASAIFAKILTAGRRFITKENEKILSSVEQQRDDPPAASAQGPSRRRSHELILEPGEAVVGPWRYPMPSGTSFAVAFVLPENLTEEDHTFISNQLPRTAESLRDLRPPVRPVRPQPVPGSSRENGSPFLNGDSIRVG